MNRLLPTLSTMLLLVDLAPSVAGGEDPPLCDLWIREQQFALDDLTLERDLARTRLVAAEEIHALLVSLLESDAVERMTYLTGKHERDAAEIRVRLAERQIELRQAALDQYRDRCSDGEGRDASSNDASLRHARAECAVLDARQQLATVDLAYDRELRTSVLDLRRNQVATRQAVIRAERDVEMSEERVERLRERAGRCRRNVARLESAGE